VCPPCEEGEPPTDEAGQIAATLARYYGHRGRTAKSLGMDRTTLWRKIKRYGLG
jgi:transcriptional regulator of acetoin/glycerol metabolism